MRQTHTSYSNVHRRGRIKFFFKHKCMYFVFSTESCQFYGFLLWDHGLALSVLCWTRLAHGRYQTATVGIRFMLLVPVRKTVCSAFELYSYRTIAESYQTATVGIRFMLLVPVRNTVCSAFELYSYSTSWVISDGRVFSETVGIRFIYSTCPGLENSVFSIWVILVQY